MDTDLIIYPWSERQPEKPQGSEMVHNAEVRAPISCQLGGEPFSAAQEEPGLLGG